MTRNQFAAICEEYTVAPCIAIENLSVINALRAGDEAALRQALENEF